jgi:hypothetical protein
VDSVSRVAFNDRIKHHQLLRKFAPRSHLYNMFVCYFRIRAANIKIQAGNIDLRTEENWTHSSVSEVYVHEDYFHKEPYYNDIALLKVSKPIVRIRIRRSSV